MKKTFEANQFEIVLEIGSPWPKELSLDFFRNSGIVPSDWEPEPTPLVPRFLGGFTFSNGVGFFADGSEFRFVETIASKKPDDFFVPRMAISYLGAVRQCDFSAVRFELRGHVEIENDEELRAFVLDRLLAEGPWRSSDPRLIDAQTMLVYDFGDAQCTLTIKKTFFQPGKEAQRDVLAFFATFTHAAVGDSAQERFESSVKLVADWRTDFDRYVSTVASHFLK